MYKKDIQERIEYIEDQSNKVRTISSNVVQNAWAIRIIMELNDTSYRGQVMLTFEGSLLKKNWRSFIDSNLEKLTNKLLNYKKEKDIKMDNEEDQEIRFKVNPAIHKKLTRLAIADGRTISGYVRHLLNKLDEKEGGEDK